METAEAWEAAFTKARSIKELLIGPRRINRPAIPVLKVYIYVCYGHAFLSERTLVLCVGHNKGFAIGYVGL